MHGPGYLLSEQGQPRNPLPALHPEFPGVVQFTCEPQSDDDELATAQTIGRMRQYALEDSQAPAIRNAARAAASEGSARKQAEAIFWWIRRHVRFVQDGTLAAPIAANPDQAEVLIRPVDLLRMPRPSGDCDDFSMLAAAMLRARGIAAEFKTVAADPSDTSRYSHVYVIAHVEDGPLVLDCSHGPWPGWEARAAGKSRIWPIDTMTKLGHIRGDIFDIPIPQLQPQLQLTTSTPFWQELAKIGAQTGAQIATARYGQPPQGTYISTPQGTLYRAPANATGLEFPTTQIGGSGSWMLLGIIGIVVVALAMRKN